MNKILTLLVIIASLTSCNNKSDKLDSVDKTDSVDSVAIPKTVAMKDSPTKSFEIFVKMLDSLGYSHDTVRVEQVRNYKELLDVKIRLVDKFPFYKMRKESTRILWWNSVARDKSDSIDVKIFSQATDIWGYFYAKKESSNLTVDGVIEQWTFSDKGTAQIALDKLNAIYPLPYFNTQPYYFIEGRHLFIFHTRASAFSYRQEELFKKFVEISSAPNKS